jgi:hypothetical protein
MPESDQGVNVLPNGDDGRPPFSTGNPVKSACASFPRVAPRPLGEREKMFRGLSQGRQRGPLGHVGLGRGRLAETRAENARLDRVGGAELA